MPAYTLIKKNLIGSSVFSRAEEDMGMRPDRPGLKTVI